MSYKNYHLIVDEEFFIFLTSKLIIGFNNGVTLGMKYQSIAYSLSGSEHVYWILGLEVEVQSLWVSWTRWPSRMQGQLSF